MTAQNKKKIAIIEDEHSLAAMYAMKLKNSGFLTEVAHSGEDGLRLVQDFMPDLILLDLRMPVMSGDEMLEKMRQYDWGASIRVIILTNISKDEAPHSLRFLNVDRYIVKAHYTPANIVRTVEEVLDIKAPRNV